MNARLPVAAAVAAVSPRHPVPMRRGRLTGVRSGEQGAAHLELRGLGLWEGDLGEMRRDQPVRRGARR